MKKKGGKGKIVVSLAPKGGVALNGDKQPELEIEVKLPEGIKAKEPVLKDKKGVKGKGRDFAIEVEVDPKAASGEHAVTVEVRLTVVKGKETKAHVIELPVPVIIP